MQFNPSPRFPPAFDPLWTLEENAIHLWRIDLRQADGAGPHALDALDENERLQASRIRRPWQAKRWMFAHSAMRSLLSRYLNIPLESVAYGRGPKGRPFVVQIHSNTPNLDFSLTHSGDRAWLAVTGSGSVGLDLEMVSLDLEWQPLMGTVCSDSESQFVLSHPLELRAGVFHRIWVRKEALLKAAGLGIGLKTSLSSIEVLGDTACLRPMGIEATWWLSDLLESGEYRAALASSMPNPRLVWNDWMD